MVEKVYERLPRAFILYTSRTFQAHTSKANPVVLKDHFEKLKKLFNDYSLTPDRIWNMDESGFNISARLQKVIAKKNARQVHKTAAGNLKEHISVCPTISAAGTYIPLLLIYKGVNVLDRLLSGLSVPPGTVAGFTDMVICMKTFLECIMNILINQFHLLG